MALRLTRNAISRKVIRNESHLLILIPTEHNMCMLLVDCHLILLTDANIAIMILIVKFLR